MTSNRSEGSNRAEEVRRQPSRLLKTEDDFTFRDLNKNGKLDVYEDARQPIQARVEDLLSQMALEEKAGTMFIRHISIIANAHMRSMKVSLRC